MKRRIKIGNKYIGEYEPVFIIAEAGVNHNGSIQIAKKLIDVAKEAGADAVKFQTFKAKNISTVKAPKAQYHINTTGNEQSWFDLLKSQELTLEQHEILQQYCNEKDIIFLSTPYDEESIELLEKLNIPAYKIASTDTNNIPLLKYLAKKKKPIILSTAMSDLDEVEESINAIHNEGLEDLVVLHCTANYPAALVDTNLKAMLTMREKFEVMVGYSDHTSENINPIAATSLGAVVYEKHFTLSRYLPGPDHQASLEPPQLKEMIQNIRLTSQALGSEIKKVELSELENRKKLRKSIVAQLDILKGTIIDRNMLSIKRPGTGIKPSGLYEILGKKAAKIIKKDTLISFEDIE